MSPEGDSINRTRQGAWRAALVALGLALVVLVFANLQALTAWVMLWVAAGHDYGLVVVAGAAWLLWRCRNEVALLSPRPDWRALLPAVVIGIGAGVASISSVQVGQLLCFILGVGALMWMVLGLPVLRVVAMPVSFLFLALPVSKFLEPGLQGLTVAATVFGLRVIGIPVFVDETYIQTPLGAIVVLAQCSGEQFFQAGLITGAFYAYLKLHRTPMRLLALATFVGLAIVGNWVRVYALVFMAILTNEQHFWFGWSVFAAAMILAFWLGHFIQEREARSTSRSIAAPASRDATDTRTEQSRGSPGWLFGAAATGVVLLAAGPVLAALTGAVTTSPGAGLAPIPAQTPWSGPYEPDGSWHPVFLGPGLTQMDAYRSGQREVTLYRAFYGRQSQGAEAVNQLNAVYDAGRWQVQGGYAGTRQDRIQLENGEHMDVIETRLENIATGSRRIVWHWYRIAGSNVITPTSAKLAQLAGVARGRQDASVTVLCTDASDPGAARDALRDFVRMHAQGVAT